MITPLMAIFLLTVIIIFTVGVCAYLLIKHFLGSTGETYEEIKETADSVIKRRRANISRRLNTAATSASRTERPATRKFDRGISENH